ncbi:MAG: AraC family transcriptional regulator [Saccharofermentanales bacterium]
MKIFKEFGNMDECDFKVKSFISSVSKINEEYLTVHPHWHDEIEVLHVLCGSAFQQVNDNIFTIEKGDTVIIRSQDIHATYTLSPEDMQILVIQFDPSILGCHTEKVDSLIARFTTGTVIPAPIHQDDSASRELSGLIMSIHGEYISDGAAKELYMVAACASLVGLCIRSFFSDSFHAQSTKDVKKTLEKIFILIDENYGRPISLEEAAGISNFSVPHFCRLFRQTVGMSFITYLNHYRINKSMLFLKDGKTITETAYLSGFNSINSYIRVFRKYTAQSPGEYRRI